MPQVAREAARSQGYDGQLLTAEFKLRTTRHKAAILKAVSSAATDAYWHMLDSEAKVLAETVLAMAVARDPSAISPASRTGVLKRSFKPARLRRFGLASEVEDGVHRDLIAQMSSYIELKLSETKVVYPAAPDPVDAGFLAFCAQLGPASAKRLWWQIIDEMQPVVAEILDRAKERGREVISRHRRLTRLGQSFPGSMLRCEGLAGENECGARRAIIHGLSKYIDEKLKERITTWPKRPLPVEEG